MLARDFLGQIPIFYFGNHRGRDWRGSDKKYNSTFFCMRFFGHRKVDSTQHPLFSVGVEISAKKKRGWRRQASSKAARTLNKKGRYECAWK